MPAEIQNLSSYGDRTVQEWHRHRFPAKTRRVNGEIVWKFSAIDLDLMGSCERCKKPLYLIEGTTRHDKTVSFLLGLAELADVPALLIFHERHGAVTGGRQFYPTVVRLPSEDAVADHIYSVRAAHICANEGRGAA